MSAKGKQWKLEQLPLAEVVEHPDFQMRAAGTDASWANQLCRALQAGEDLKPIRVARIGKALYVVDGFHRLEAHRRAKRGTILAEVARVSKTEAVAEATVANTRHGKRPSRADQQRAWDAFLADGRHLKPGGGQKGSTTIERELGFVYSRETIRRKLKAAGLELDEATEYPEGHKPRRTEVDLAYERQEAAGDALEDFRAAYLSLDDPVAQRHLLISARSLVDALGRGDEPAYVRVGPMDI